MKHNRGIGLADVLAVVACVALVAVVTASRLSEAQARSRIADTHNALRATTMALQGYLIDNNQYPAAQDHHFQVDWNNFGSTLATPPLHGRTPSLLTTPVAYLATLPADPFLGPEELAPFPEDTIPYGRFQYYNYPFYRRALPNYETTPLARMEKRAGPWILLGVGPDRTDFNGSASPPWQRYVDYDPTNGAVSAGNILRIARGGALNLDPATY